LKNYIKRIYAPFNAFIATVFFERNKYFYWQLEAVKAPQVLLLKGLSMKLTKTRSLDAV